MKAAIMVGCVVLSVLQAPAAHAETMRWSCYPDTEDNYEDSRYTFTVNTRQRIAKFIESGTGHKTTTFRILRATNSDKDDECGKMGWKLSEGAMFCVGTKGGGFLERPGHQVYNCD